MEIKDKYGRTFKTLRVSLTNTCNLGCIYCTHSSGQKLPLTNTQKILTSSEITFLIKEIHALTKIDTLRLTGGEPTLYKDLVKIIKEIRAIGIENIKMTSNGYLLKEMLPELFKAGLKSINISLDTLDAENFTKISGRKNLEKIVDTIDEALKFGIDVKINTVMLKGINEAQLIPLLNFAKKRSLPIRFLELMKMGPLHEAKEFHKHFFSEKEVLTKIEKQYNLTSLPRDYSATANYWITDDGYKFGIIANETSPFCHDCNRLRLDSYGNIYGCLSNDNALSIADSLTNEGNLKEKLEEALLQKQELKFKGSSISMMAIGG
ncbi:MAG TPA: GTP 3',8-cyclase MoaA [Cytophagaceae bacterium]|jgi:cyclic pyranopterin phosphate synthase|nr:GTP 3',8-cyclase MoaA [Cytophagaceae bacterium]